MSQADEMSSLLGANSKDTIVIDDLENNITIQESAPTSTNTWSSNNGTVYPEPLSREWRIQHFTAYIIGGTFFFIASFAYLPSLENYSFGAWIFTLGSASFLYADIKEWRTNNKVGCFYDNKLQQDMFENAVGRYMKDSVTTNIGKYQRAENGINFFCSIIGSAFYLLGSFLFIPNLNSILAGSWIFIFGSAIIFCSQTWKIYRAACYNPDNPYDHSFNTDNLHHDIPAVVVDVGAGIGGLFYLIGTVYFLPEHFNETNAAIWFIFGGLFFSLSGIAMYYRYFYTLNYPH